MAYQFYNDGATLRLVENGANNSLPKLNTRLEVFGNNLVVQSIDRTWSIPYTSVTIPASVSAEDLREIVETYLDTTATNTNEARFTEQFTQTDLLNLVLLELQEQTKILKKIYQ